MSGPGAVEALCGELRQHALAGGPVDLWVPDELTYAGSAVPKEPTGIAMAIITDMALSLGLWPDGFTQGNGGRTYHYKSDAA